MFGLNMAKISDAAVNLVPQAGFTEARRMAGIPVVYASPSPDWSSFDWAMTQAHNAGLHPLVTLTYTPDWLLPSPNPCVGQGSLENAPPTDIQKWAQIAASYVAHLDNMFPGLVQDFEIWNEPELQTSFCVADNADATRLATYLELYGAAAAAMRAQANADRVQISIGGPTMSRVSLIPEWLPALLSNPSTAPNVDFVSFHLYLTGLTQIAAGMNWNQLYSTTQSSTKGLAFDYSQVLSLTRQGSQPHASSTPIYVTEYNDNWAFAKDCCRNDPTFGPLWNAVAIADLLNSVYAGADALPGKIYYFAGSEAPYFCIVGRWDASMDCDPSQNNPYPQYYAFQLLAGQNYLGLTTGGYMAASVSSVGAATGTVTTAFFNASQNAIVIINPSSSDLSQVSVTAKNPGFTSAVGSEYLLNRQNPRIATMPLSLTTVSGGFAATVDVPAYSTLVVVLRAGHTNVAPTAVLSITPQSGLAPLTVTADSSRSSDSDGSIVSRKIDFGDGSTPATTATASHIYQQAGNYTVRLTVTDNGGLSSSAAASVEAAGVNSTDFTLTATLNQTTGNQTSYSVTVAPLVLVNKPVVLSCSQVPAGMACSFSPSSVTPGSHPANSVLTVAPVATASADPSGKHHGSGLALAMWLALPGIAFMGPSFSIASRSRSLARKLVLASLGLVVLALQIGCTAALPGATTNRTGSVVVVASTANHSHAVTLTLGQ
jgi:PKD repeat protein